MKNFKEIADKCLAGELKGTFKNRKGDSISSEALCRYSSKTYPYSYYYSNWACVTIHGDFFKSGKFSKYDIIDFIPNNMQKNQIKIDVPEGKVPVMEQTESGVVITWKEKELTYNDIYHDLVDIDRHVSVPRYCNNNCNSQQFNKKVEVLRKLTNIRNYFGKPDNMLEGWCIFKHSLSHKLYVDKEYCASKFKVVFAKKEHAEQAIKMLGDEIEYLFEPW